MKVSHLLRCAAVGSVLVSNVIDANEIGSRLDCHFGAHEFIEQLVEEKEIDPLPMNVSGNSVNAYRLRPNQNLTALGFKVRAVFGFSPNDEMFAQKSGGGDLSHQVYGVVVLAGKEAVSERLRETGSPATVKEVMPLVMSAVVCEI
ncbi:hypothetical protein M3I54_35195 [Paraburkholderia sp. CNPSo 3274]|uniref:hypothetical protein n=1 Tax=Paraburkholderia sp. CNPSo 3274 TaxID=2940932 RepID=UPI0020B68893|nr:hypothetical protein [Paraburkholderia sp. CNPSo 3274]MCP3712135.1 hypothetical protein [Paraburkholderia sp. CNPSo 3274]